MPNDTSNNDTAELLTDHGFALRDDADGGAASSTDVEEDELEFQPIQRTGLHWLTLVLIGLLLWGGGFLVGVLVDRALAG